MTGQAPSSLMNIDNLLWLGAAVVATGLLAASMNRRRGGLVQTLRNFVRRNQPPDDPPGSTSP